MAVDKDKISTWVKYKDSMCRSCIGTCCTMPVEVKIDDLVRLGYATEDDLTNSSPQKIAKQLQKQKLVRSYRESTQLFMLEHRPNGDCHLLHPTTRLCTKYEIRPNVCRSFPTTMGNRKGFCPKIEKAKS